MIGSKSGFSLSWAVISATISESTTMSPSPGLHSLRSLGSINSVTIAGRWPSGNDCAIALACSITMNVLRSRLSGSAVWLKITT